MDWIANWISNWINVNIPKQMQPAILTSAATLIGAFIGACVAQYFSHRLVLKRERKSNQRVFYNELYAPILPEIYTYCDYITEFNRGILKDEHPIDEKKLLGEINEHIVKNIKYASPKIINAYNKFKQFEYIDDLSGMSVDLAQFTLFEEILNELIKIAPFDRKSKREIKKYRTMYFLLRIITNMSGTETAIRFLREKYNFKKNILYRKHIYLYLRFFFKFRWNKFVEPFFDKYGHRYFLDVLVQKEYRPLADSIFKEDVEKEKLETDTDNKNEITH
ncbi:hypothetical protein AX282_21335 [Bacillus spizizenii]|uniref:hypothetical protein n=1 Tax=Bacillus spizizenii TaxID=96241 RepID=UPI000772A5DE|nr:hypothetical protein [Bacillus spizizenii]KXJ36543.1 hypothetical protein AX282_21335 [Bacillus spizizenii]